MRVDDRWEEEGIDKGRSRRRTTRVAICHPFHLLLLTFITLIPVLCHQSDRQCHQTRQAPGQSTTRPSPGQHRCPSILNQSSTSHWTLSLALENSVFTPFVPSPLL